METTHSFSFQDLPLFFTVEMPDEREEIQEIIALIGDRHFPRDRKKTQIKKEYYSPSEVSDRLGISV